MDMSEFAPRGPNPARATTEETMKPGQWYERSDGTIVYKQTAEEVSAVNKRREEASRTLREYQALCFHDPAHAIDVFVSDEEQAFRDWMKKSGWYDQGYCPAYYPLWLRDTYRFNVGPLPDADILDAEIIG